MAPPRDYRVTITVEGVDSTLSRIHLLTEALLRVVQGSKLLRVLSADYHNGCIDLVLEGSPTCDGVSAKVHVDMQTLPEGRHSDA